MSLQRPAFLKMTQNHLNRPTLKEELSKVVRDILAEKKMTQTEAGKILNTTQSEISLFLRGGNVSISEGRLIEYLTLLGQNVSITIEPTKDNQNVCLIVKSPSKQHTSRNIFPPHRSSP